MSSSEISQNGQDEGRRSRTFESFREFLLNEVARSIGNSPQGAVTASDFVQDTLIAAMVAERNGNGPGPTEQDARLWLKTILRNKINELHRHNKAKENGGGRVEVPMPDNVADDGTTPSEGGVKNEERRRLDEAINMLSEADRQLAVWLMKEGLSRREIADRLRVSPSYASRVCREVEERLYQAYKTKRCLEDKA